MSETSHSRKKLAIYYLKNRCRSVVYYLFFLSDFNETGIFLTAFQNYLNIKFNEIRSLGAELFRADGQTDGQK